MKAISLATLVLVSGLCFAQSNDAAMKKAKADLQNAKAYYEKSKAAFTKAPKDAKKKKTYVDATVSYGTITMTSPALESKAKYPGALRLYREALKVDPKNETAKNNAKMIEDIYRSMNRPIPK